MKSPKKIFKVTCSSVFLSLLAATVSLCLDSISYGQGTLTETMTTMEVQQEMRSGQARQRGENTATDTSKEEQPIAKFEKVAKKLLGSLQTGTFDSEDFSPMWKANMPPGADFSKYLKALYRPVLAQYGRAEKLGPGRMAEPDKATFPLQFSGGTLDMTFSLDAENKIIEWLLTPPAASTDDTEELKTDTMQSTAPNMTEDTNDLNIEDFNSFQRELNRVNIEIRSEDKMWTGQSTNKAELAKAIEELVTAQLLFIRKLAESENAEQTVKAVNLVIQQRRKRLAQLNEELKDERLELRDRRTTRSERQGQGDRERTRERPTRRPREPDSE